MLYCKQGNDLIKVTRLSLEITGLCVAVPKPVLLLRNEQLAGLNIWVHMKDGIHVVLIYAT